jgi:hypothetical protein
MKQLKTILTICLLALSTIAMAQTKSYKKVRIGLGLEGALPMGSLKAAYNYGGGATFRVAVALNEKSAITGTTGVMAFVPEKITGVNTKAQLNIPIKAGYKYMLTEKLYGLGEVGTTIVKSYYPTATGSLASVSSNAFTYSVGIGVHVGVDASLRYEGYSNGGFLGLRLGFNF